MPDTNFDELANVSNGGTAIVNSPVSPGPGQVVLGESAGESGTLNIGNGGNLPVTFTTGNVTNGGVNVGQAGTGHLIVQPGGTLTARTLTVAGETGSSVVLGGTAARHDDGDHRVRRNLRAKPAGDWPECQLLYSNVRVSAGEYLRRTNHGGNSFGAQIDEFGHTWRARCASNLARA